MTLGVIERPCFASLAGCSGFMCITELGTAASSCPWGWTQRGERPETPSRDAQRLALMFWLWHVLLQGKAEGQWKRLSRTVIPSP